MKNKWIEINLPWNIEQVECEDKTEFTEPHPTEGKKNEVRKAQIARFGKTHDDFMYAMFKQIDPDDLDLFMDFIRINYDRKTGKKEVSVEFFNKVLEDIKTNHRALKIKKKLVNKFIIMAQYYVYDAEYHAWFDDKYKAAIADWNKRREEFWNKSNKEF